MSWETTERNIGSITLLELRGRLTGEEGTDLLTQKFQSLIAQGRYFLLLDCSQVTVVDSSGIGTLVRCFISLDKRGGQLKLLNLSPPMQMALRVLGLIESMESFADETEALASFRRTQ